MAASLKKQFPGEEEAIDEFMRLMKVSGWITHMLLSGRIIFS